MKSKKNNVLELFFLNPKYWHFEELLKKAKITRPQLTHWLKTFQREGFIKRIKNKGKMPYYVHDFNNPNFIIQKKMFAREKLINSGLLRHLISLEDVRVVILFGSYSRFDWYEDSDIDIFIFGNDKHFYKSTYEKILGREIQVHNAKNQKDLKKMNKLLPYIISGDFIKGSINDLGVEINAKN